MVGGSSPIIVLITAPDPLLHESTSFALGGYLYPNPPLTTLIARRDPSVPKMGDPTAPTPPPPLRNNLPLHPSSYELSTILPV